MTLSFIKYFYENVHKAKMYSFLKMLIEANCDYRLTFHQNSPPDDATIIKITGSYSAPSVDSDRFTPEYCNDLLNQMKEFVGNLPRFLKVEDEFAGIAGKDLDASTDEDRAFYESIDKQVKDLEENTP